MININLHLTCKHAEVCLGRGKSEAVQIVNSVTEADKIKVPLRLMNITDIEDYFITVGDLNLISSVKNLKASGQITKMNKLIKKKKKIKPAQIQISGSSFPTHK